MQETDAQQLTAGDLEEPCETDRVMMFYLSSRMLHQLLELPPHVKLCGAWYSPQLRGWEVLIESLDFDKVPVGALAPLCDMNYTINYCDTCGRRAKSLSIDKVDDSNS